MMKKIISCISTVLAVAGMCMTAVSCEPEGLVDNSEFMLYYPGISDIGPSTNFNITPTYHGAAPSDFTVDKVTFEGRDFQHDNFVVDSENGTFSLIDTENLEVGVYKVSISCVSSGSRYSFNDIITINMMKPVPDGITVTPNVISIDINDIIQPKAGAHLPTAKIEADGNSVTIKKFLLSTVTRDGTVIENASKLFSVEETTGIVSINENPDFIPGKYVLAFKLTTYLVSEQSEEGIFKDALTVDVTSKPYMLSYSPAEANAEAGYEFKSVAPEMAGTQEDVVYTIKSVTKNGTELVSEASFSIDAATGVISIAAGNALVPGDSYVFAINVKNKYGENDFEEAYRINIVEYIEPITDFAYDDFTAFSNAAFTITPGKTTGDFVTYSFAELPDACAPLTINAETGEITAKKDNGIPDGTYPVKVTAKNVKGEMSASFNISVIQNPNKFTFVHYGNNLGLTPAKDYASQYRFGTSANMQETPITVCEHDLPEGVAVKYEIDFGNSIIDANKTNSDKAKEAISINGNTGEIKLKGGAFGKNRVMMLLVVVTTGDDPASQVSVKVPVFIHTEDPLKPEGYSGDGIFVRYTPFVYQVNPVTGGTSKAPEIIGVSDMTNFRLEYRQDFIYANINGPESHKTGLRSDKGAFIRYLWDAFYIKINKTVNYGQKYPLSFYQGVKDGWLNTYALGYVNTYEPSKNPTGKYEIKINPNVWKDDQGIFANGAMLGKIAYSIDGSEPDKLRIIPVAVWFDEKF